jgi:exonuclease VII large subunit
MLSDWEVEEEAREHLTADVQRLAMFFAGVAADPSRFPVTGNMAPSLKKAARRAKGPAQRLSRAVKRTQGQQKRDRQARREAVAAYNEARERVERDMQEMEEAHAQRVAQIEAMLAQRTFNHAELVELFTLLGSPELAAKAVELHTREENPQAIIDAAAQAASQDPALRTHDGHDVGDPNWESRATAHDGGIAMDLSDHPALD